MKASLAELRDYPFIFNIVPFVGGLLDPVMGAISTIVRVLTPFRISTRADTPKRRKRGIVFVLGGVEGLSQYTMKMANSMLAGRYRGSVVVFPWNKCVMILTALRNLMSKSHQETQSDKLVEQICAYRREFPDAKVALLAQSGGCYIVVRALEKLPPDIRIDRAVLLAPSMSPGYDIRPAAARCRRGLHSLGGPGDFFFLGFGTLLFGTSDRLHSPSAGLVGWHHKSPNFYELRWHPDWLRFGYLGNHLTTANFKFLRDVVARMI